MSRKLKKGNKGITLIALIITIIVMLILVGVAIDVTIDGKIFDKTDEAVDKTNNKVSQQQERVNELTEKLIEVEQSQCTHNYVNYVCTKCEKKAVVTAGERAEIKSQYIDTSVSPNKTAIIPIGFTVSGVSSEQTIDGGLVIYQISENATVDWTTETGRIAAKENYSQFVWIPVDEPNKMIMCKSEGTDTDKSGTVEDDEYMSCNIEIEESTGKVKCTTHNSYNLAGRLYYDYEISGFNKTLTTQTYPSDESDYIEPTIVSDETYGDWKNIDKLQSIVGITGENDDEVKTNWINQMQTTFNDMAKSIIENKGFYVGRYETSMNGNIAESKSNKTTMNNESWYTMYKNQQTIGKEELGVVSHMIWRK